MARPPKNPNHPLVRLRAILSTPATKKVPANEMSRDKFAKKTGVPATSLKDIENGEYNLSWEVAVEIAFTFGVHPKSLMGKGPLLDLQGLPFSKTSPKPVHLTPLAEEAQEQLCLAAWEVANEKKFGQRVSYRFERWLLETFEAYGLKTALSEKLTERLGLFDPEELSEFRPKNKHLSDQWEKALAEIHQEQLQVFKQDKIAFPDSPNAGKAQVFLDHLRMIGCRHEAVEKLRERGRPTHGKQPPSATRKAA